MNKTGEAVTDITITDNVTGEICASPTVDGEEFILQDGEGIILYMYIPDNEDGEHRLTLSFRTAGGREESFKTLSVEEVTIDLLPAATDATTGATPIAFSKIPELQTGTYTIYNHTGETVLSVTLTDNEDSASRYGFTDGLEPGGSQIISWSVPADRENVTLTLDFVTASGKQGSFKTLKIETVPIWLLDVDTVSGATPISFRNPAAE